MIGFKQIAIRELPTWIKVFKGAGMNKEEMLSELELIDDLLVLMKSKSLLNRKKNLKTQLEARIGFELGHKTANLNTR
jgi:hypothetical protein